MITKAQIVTEINARLDRAETETTLAAAITAALLRLSAAKKWKCMWTSAAITVEDGDYSAAQPADFRLMDAVTIYDGASNYEMTEYDRKFAEYVEGRLGTPATGRPQEWCLRGGNIYFGPEADGDYTLTVYYWRYHPAGDSVLFGDVFAEAIYAAVASEYLRGLGLTGEAKFGEVEGAYAQQVGLLSGEIDRDLQVCEPFI